MIDPKTPHPYPKTEGVKKRESEELDEALDDSFPASDPPSQTQPKKHPDEDADDTVTGKKVERPGIRPERREPGANPLGAFARIGRSIRAAFGR